MTYTNSSMSTFRRCQREYEWRYIERIERDAEESEALTVGSTWHAAQEARAKGEDPYEAIQRGAPNELWQVKLSRLFAAHEWYWQDASINVVETEREFCVPLRLSSRDEVEVAGIIDGVVELEDGRRGIIEYKTTSFDLSADSRYWSKLRMDTQVGLYGLAFRELFGDLPDFILYDVTRKPTINPARLTKKAMEAIIEEADLNDGTFTLYGESMECDEEVVQAISDKKESPKLYGARLTRDIGERPDHYFARREIPRTESDYDALLEDVIAQISGMRNAVACETMHRNPDACNVFGTCDFFGLCSNNVTPSGKVPDGFRLRARRHAELSPETQGNV